MRLRTVSTLLLAATLWACQSSGPQGRYESIHEQIRHGDYAEALEGAQRLRDENPDDGEAAALHKKASVAYLLERGRRLTFDDQDDEALAVFEQVVEFAPESRQAQMWLEKTRRKLATRWIHIGLELHATDNLEGAIEAYKNALKYAPGDESAENGLEVAEFITQHRQEVGGEYYKDGVRALADYWLEQAYTNFAYSLKYDEKDSRSELRRAEVKEMLAQQRVHLGREFERDGLYGAAHTEYRIALTLDENAEAREGLERTQREADAKKLLDEAEMHILRDNLDRARELLSEGSKLTTLQTEQFQGMRDSIENAVYEGMYQEALNHERDLEYVEAVQAFDRLLAQANWFKDALARRTTLQGNIEAAAERYEQARMADSDEERYQLLQEIELYFWPNYRDVRSRLKALEPQVGAELPVIEGE